MDLLEALRLHNTSYSGVSLTEGPVKPQRAYLLQGEHRSLQAGPEQFRRASALLRQSGGEFTLAATLKQEEGNIGTVVAFSTAVDRYLELQSSGRRDEVRLHYTLPGDDTRRVYIEVFQYRLADNQWHKLAVTISGSQVELLVDCHSVYRRVLKPGPPDRNFSARDLELWVGQRNKHSYFKGALSSVRLISGPHGHVSQCPHVDSTCPTCGQFGQLQDQVRTLTDSVRKLAQRLVQAESNVASLQQCDCVKACDDNGTMRQDGARWQKDCDICECMHGVIECRKVHCAAVNCSHPEPPKRGECCATCLKDCYYDNQTHQHGAVYQRTACTRCLCIDGSMHCEKQSCPQLQCSEHDRITVQGSCCKVCRDIDECQHKGDINGHHCNQNTFCQNTPGSYVCQCLPGYTRLDKFNCAEHDECHSGQHSCDEQAHCVNTQGSYDCVCKEGYRGDGYSCEPICSQPCLNGGSCTAPGLCTCQPGFAGQFCEQDLDECQAGQHRCDKTAVCVNMPGWYYCKCKHGYEAVVKENFLGTDCKDIDECATDTHTCHPTAKCVNSDGKYECQCQPDDPDCRLSCMFEGSELAHGATTIPSSHPCRRCQCSHGVVTCRDVTCDCTARRGAIPESCCPQCNPDKSCRHQELARVVFRSGEKWIYQCQTCECLYGEIDCWPMECPPYTCSDPILSPGDCCPRCPTDLCAWSTYGNSTSNSTGTDNASTSVGAPCRDATQFRAHGEEWRRPEDRCTSCNCKDGTICCNYDFRCNSLLDATSLDDGSVDNFVLENPDDIYRQLLETSSTQTTAQNPTTFPRVGEPETGGTVIDTSGTGGVKNGSGIGDVTPETKTRSAG